MLGEVDLDQISCYTIELNSHLKHSSQLTKSYWALYPDKLTASCLLYADLAILNKKVT